MPDFWTAVPQARDRRFKSADMSAHSKSHPCYPQPARRGEHRYIKRGSGLSAAMVGTPTFRSPTQFLFASKTRGAPAYKDLRNITGADSNPPTQPFARTAEYCSSSAVDYSPWCFTNFPFGSISNPDSLPFALTNTS